MSANIFTDLTEGLEDVSGAWWNPAGLTTRQSETLRLFAGGSTNAEIGERLYISTKTVDHHVSALLSKLHVTSRRDAVRRGSEIGIVG